MGGMETPQTQRMLENSRQLQNKTRFSYQVLDGADKDRYRKERESKKLSVC
jgi:hypothetical protein